MWLQKGEENMLSIEIRFAMQGKEVSVDSFIEDIVRKLRASVRDEISRVLAGQETQSRATSPVAMGEPSRQAVSVREAARLLSVSRRTIENYIASKSIRAVRVGRRVLVPMKSVNEVAMRGVPSKRSEKPTCSQTSRISIPSSGVRATFR
jgi:excisionase family DNA binding protein